MYFTSSLQYTSSNLLYLNFCVSNSWMMDHEYLYIQYVLVHLHLIVSPFRQGKLCLQLALLLLIVIIIPTKIVITLILLAFQQKNSWCKFKEKIQLHSLHFTFKTASTLQIFLYVGIHVCMHAYVCLCIFMLVLILSNYYKWHCSRTF